MVRRAQLLAILHDWPVIQVSDTNVEHTVTDATPAPLTGAWSSCPSYQITAESLLTDGCATGSVVSHPA